MFYLRALYDKTERNNACDGVAQYGVCQVVWVSGSRKAEQYASTPLEDSISNVLFVPGFHIKFQYQTFFYQVEAQCR